MKKIIYTNTEGVMCIMTPTPEYLETHTVEEAAIKDVPNGLPYYIVNENELPTDRTFRSAWEYQE
jgi:hypothetical protein